MAINVQELLTKIEEGTIGGFLVDGAAHCAGSLEPGCAFHRYPLATMISLMVTGRAEPIPPAKQHTCVLCRNTI